MFFLGSESFCHSYPSQAFTLILSYFLLFSGSERGGICTGTEQMLNRTILPPNAKVVMYVKGEKPGEKPRLVKLRPVANPSKPDLRFAYETIRKATQKTSLSLPPRARKRRIIRPLAKKVNKVGCFIYKSNSN